MPKPLQFSGFSIIKISVVALTTLVVAGCHDFRSDDSSSQRISSAMFDSNMSNSGMSNDNMNDANFSMRDKMVSDHALHDQVHVALDRNMFNTNQRIKVNVRENDVYLYGVVSEPEQRRQAIAVVESVDGVSNVYYDDLSIANIPSNVDSYSDSAVQARIHRVLNQNMPNRAVRVSVNVKNSNASLYGSVTSEKDRNELYFLVRQVEGVRLVDYSGVRVVN